MGHREKVEKYPNICSYKFCPIVIQPACDLGYYTFFEQQGFVVETVGQMQGFRLFFAPSSFFMITCLHCIALSKGRGLDDGHITVVCIIV